MSTPNPASTDWVPVWALSGTTPFGVIPGEVKLWGGKVLPTIEYGKWVWADGAIYATSLFPKASANIAPEWKTAHGVVDPGAGNFRVPDLRGLTPVALDAMPGGARANRTARAVAIIVARTTGEETHVVSIAETPAHNHGGATGGQSADHTHGVGDPGHSHILPDTTRTGRVSDYADSDSPVGSGWGGIYTGLGYANVYTAGASVGHYHGVSSQGGGAAHETMQPSVFVPYIVALDS